MKRIVAGPDDASGDLYRWRIDQQGRVTHRDPGIYHHAAKTLYVRDMARWLKVGYWCDRCGIGLLLESRSTGDVAQTTI